MAVSLAFVLLLYMLSRQKKMGQTVTTSLLVGILGAAGMVAGALFDPANSCACSSGSLLSFSTLGMVVFCTLGCTLFSTRDETPFTCLRRIVVSGMLMAGGMVIAKWLISSSISSYLGTSGGSHWSMFGGMLLGTFLAEEVLSGAGGLTRVGEPKIAGT